MRSERPSDESDVEILVTGNLATPRRTVLGVFGHFAQTDMDAEAVAAALAECGIPPIALDEPDIPITHAQQLACVAWVVERATEGRSVERMAFDVAFDVRITSFGVLGLAALHASDLFESLRVFTRYPELSWGHSRITAGRAGDALFTAFVADDEITEPAARRYCVTIDAIAAVQMIRELFGPEPRPRAVELPYPAPPDHRSMTRRLGCPVVFDAPEARVLLDPSLLSAEPLLANPFLFRAYEKQARQLAERLRTDVDLGEQVRRLLWATSPPPDRDTVASMLALSPRSLARKLAGEGTSYGELLEEVRHARARDLLRNRGLQIAEIADRLGYSDAAAFSRAFRGWADTTPSAWRDAHGG